MTQTFMRTINKVILKVSTVSTLHSNNSNYLRNWLNRNYVNTNNVEVPLKSYCCDACVNLYDETD